jgi:hypothetical protein
MKLLSSIDSESAMPYDAKLAHRLRTLLARRKGITEKTMFGGIGFLLDEHMLVGVWKESLIARVGPGAYESALAESHVREFDITGRPMQGWIMVEPAGLEDDADLKGWVDTAVKFVRTLPKK